MSSGTSIPVPWTARSMSPRFTVSENKEAPSTLGAAGRSRVKPKEIPATASNARAASKSLRIVLARGFCARAISINFFLTRSLVTERYSRIDAAGATARDQPRQRRDKKHENSNSTKYDRIKRPDAEELRLNPTGQGGGAESTERDADGGSCRCLQKDHGKNLRRRRAQGHANADLAHAARDRIGSHAVDSDDREQQGRYRETTDQDQAESARFKRSRESLLQSTECDGHFRIEAAHNGACSGKRGLRRRGGAGKDGETPNSVRALETVDVNSGTGRNFEGPVTDVTHDADNRKEPQIAVHVSKFNLVAEWILIRPFFVGEGLADQSNVRSIGGVAVIEEAALQDGDAERLEVALGGDGIVSVAKVGFIAK